jgi:hypothetical protein
MHSHWRKGQLPSRGNSRLFTVFYKSMPSEAPQTTLGFRVKSGWATAVLLTGPAACPRVLDRRSIDLCDPETANSRQPYHAVMEAAPKDAAKIEARLCKIVRDAAETSVRLLLADLGTKGHQPKAGGLVVGSNIDPVQIKNEHIRAHAQEGRLFRSALEDALTSHGLKTLLLVEREAYAKAAKHFDRPEGELKRAVAELGRTFGGPWRTDEKTAALAAWMALK